MMFRRGWLWESASLNCWVFLGLILPMALRILPQLTPIAAIGLAAAAGSGLVFHLLRGESNVWINIIFILLAVIIAAGRFRLLQGG